TAHRHRFEVPLVMAPLCNEQVKEKDTDSHQPRKDANVPVLKREVGLFSATALLIGAVIGSGIFITPSIVFRNSGSAGVAIVVWFVSGITTILAVSVCAFGTLFAVSFVNARVILAAARQGHLPAACSFITVNSSVPLAATLLRGFLSLVYTFAGSVGFLVESCAFLYNVYDICGVLCLFVLRSSMKDARRLYRAPTALAVVKLLISVSLVVMPLVNLDEYLHGHARGTQTFAPDCTSHYTYSFYRQSISNIAGEMTDPRRNIPWALMAGISVVTVLSLLVNVAYFAVLGPATVANSEAIGVSFASATWGTAGAVLIALAVMISTFGTMCAGFFSSTRVILAVARHGHLPAIFGSINVKSSVPLTPLLLRGFLAQVYASTGSVENLLPNMVFLFTVANLFVIVAFFVLRFTMKNAPRPYRAPTLFPVLWLAFIVFLSSCPVVRSVEHMQYGVMTAMFLSGTAYYAVFVHFKLSLPGARVVTCCVQKLLFCAPCFSDLDVAV
ncbi:unnamed protein product, partial [Ixodes hexagonus]